MRPADAITQLPSPQPKFMRKSLRLSVASIVRVERPIYKQLDFLELKQDRIVRPHRSQIDLEGFPLIYSRTLPSYGNCQSGQD